MASPKCPKCGRSIHRARRRWFEKLLMVKEAYRCARCKHRRYRPVGLGKIVYCPFL